MAVKKKKLFISYAHKDGIYLDRLVEQLQAAAIDSIELWDDKKIRIGQEWEKEIEKALNDSFASILMISAKFLNSKYISSNEVPKLLQKYNEKGMQIFPIIVRSCPWEEHQWLNKFQFHKPFTPLASLNIAKQEEKLSDFAREVKRCLRSNDKP